MRDFDHAAWLLETGGPVVRWRTATELFDDTGDLDLDPLRRDLLASDPVRLWLSRLQPDAPVHGSFDGHLENVVAKLVELGLRAGMEPLDVRMRPWLDHLGEPGREGFLPIFERMTVAAVLTRAGYGNEEGVRAEVLRRLDRIHGWVREDDLEIHVSPGTFTDVPRTFHDRPILKPELHPDDDLRLPTIHDLYAFAHLPPGDLAIERKIGAVVRRVLDSRYQKLPDGYGVLRVAKRRYYACGWSVHLPGTSGFDLTDHVAASLVPRVELFARFPTARKSTWIRSCLSHLEGFRSVSGTWHLPRRYLREKPGYAVTGARSGLGENRRLRRWREIESTFRMLKIQRLAASRRRAFA